MGFLGQEIRQSRRPEAGRYTGAGDQDELQSGNRRRESDGRTRESSEQGV